VVRSAVDMWSCLSGHPGLLVPLEGLVASELDGSPSLVVVHSYVPGAVTLAQAHLQPTQVGVFSIVFCSAGWCSSASAALLAAVVFSSAPFLQTACCLRKRVTCNQKAWWHLSWMAARHWWWCIAMCLAL
jgi:hypothetical protein